MGSGVGLKVIGGAGYYALISEGSAGLWARSTAVGGTAAYLEGKLTVTGESALKDVRISGRPPTISITMNDGNESGYTICSRTPDHKSCYGVFNADGYSQGCNAKAQWNTVTCY